MEIAEYKNIYTNEESHFFYVSLHRLIIKLIEKYSGEGRKEILDAGCGTGGLMTLMKKFGSIRGIDFSEEAVRLSKKRRLNVQQASVTKLPFKAKTFDVVTCIDVLCHNSIGDDVAAMIELRRVLKIGGILIIRLQADKHLSSSHDRFVHSKRRYSMRELKAKLKKAGFEVGLISYIHSPLWPVVKIKVWLEKLMNKKAAESGVATAPWLVNKILIWILGRESDLILEGIRPQRGLGLIAVAKKTSGKHVR